MPPSTQAIRSIHLPEQSSPTRSTGPGSLPGCCHASVGAPAPTRLAPVLPSSVGPQSPNELAAQRCERDPRTSGAPLACGGTHIDVYRRQARNDRTLLNQCSSAYGTTDPSMMLSAERP